jgi:SsrA-binding protein
MSGVKIIVQNKKAYFNFAIEAEIEAGIMLVGSEVKSLREGKTNINDAYVAEEKGELYLINAMISEFKGANRFNHEPKRKRKLLLHKKEMTKIIGKMAIKGLSLVALKMYFKNGNVKVLLGLAKGKKLYDKRETLKKKDEARRQARGEE